MKRLLTIQDISCFGKCSLTAALPVISAMGVETSVIPSAVLSTHTGSGFSGYTFRDLTDDIPDIAAHWKKLGLKFDAIYTGYIGSVRQVDIIKRLIDDLRADDAVVVVDPVMGDGGRLYSGLDNRFVTAMRSLCACADCILPNSTEAAMLLGSDYRNDHSTDEIRAMLRELCSLGCGTAIMTGYSPSPELNGAMAYGAAEEKFYVSLAKNVSGSFHSTGDIFSSVFTGGLTLGMDIQRALDLAVDFTRQCIEETLRIREEHWYSVRFEPCIGKLAEACREYL